MNVIDAVKRNTCGICFEPFRCLQNAVTHVGGERHDGFHEDCLKEALKYRSTCPLDRMQIDGNSFITRTDRIMKKCKQALHAAAYTAFLGFTLEESLMILSKGLQARALSVGAAGLSEEKIESFTSMAKIVATLFAGMEVGSQGILLRELSFTGQKLAVSLGAGVIGLGLESVSLELPGEGAVIKPLVAGALQGLGISGLAMGAAVGIDAILTRRGVIDRTVRENIGIGMFGCGIALSSIFFGVGSTSSLTATTVASLFGGAIAGVTSLVRG